MAIKLLQVPASDCHWIGVDRGLGCEEGRTVDGCVRCPLQALSPFPFELVLRSVWVF